MEKNSTKIAKDCCSIENTRQYYEFFNRINMKLCDVNGKLIKFDI